MTAQDANTYKLISSITGQIVKVVSINANYEDRQKQLDEIRLNVATTICQPCRFLTWVDNSYNTNWPSTGE
jgi:hypothetical protein